jgi:hypothetical protein
VGHTTTTTTPRQTRAGKGRRQQAGATHRVVLVREHAVLDVAHGTGMAGAVPLLLRGRQQDANALQVVHLRPTHTCKRRRQVNNKGAHSTGWGACVCMHHFRQQWGEGMQGGGTGEEVGGCLLYYLFQVACTDLMSSWLPTLNPCPPTTQRLDGPLGFGAPGAAAGTIKM